MPGVLSSSHARVLVTGASGYIAMWVVQHLLQEGYSVRGTVRSHNKSAEVTDYFPEYAGRGSLQVIVAGDLTQKGAFDEAVKDVDAVIHTAPPVAWLEGEPEEILNPVLKGTIGVLESVLRYGCSSVQRVILTSSMGTVSRTTLDRASDANTKILTFSEDIWNEESPEICRQFGKNAPPLDKYEAAKTAAEKAAWKFVEEHNDEIEWDFVALQPSWVFGPPIQKWTDPNQVNTTTKMWYDVVFNEERVDYLDNSEGGWVDVEDVALGHVRALQKPEAGGHRFLLVAGSFYWNEFNDIANKLKPTFPNLLHPIAPLRPDIATEYRHIYLNEKARGVLGVEFRTKEETTHATLKWAKRGTQ